MLQHFMASYTSRFSTHIPPGPVIRDLQWWASQLQSPGIFRTLHDQGPLVDLGISVDASTDFGIGLRVCNEYKAWCLHTGAVGLGGCDIGWLESLAIEFAIHYLKARGTSDMNVQILANNRGSIGAFMRGKGRNRWSNDSIQWSFPIVQQGNFEVIPVYVKSAENPADVVSHGLFGGLSHIPQSFPVPAELEEFIYEV
jgi:hypothetical protein